ncbi:MAG TPA: hypothetical protein VF909_01325, partial [Roseiflexaceae bacterium]
GRLVVEGPPRSVFVLRDRLRAWGLATPPLNQLLTLLRERGLAISADAFTLEEVFAALQALYKLSEIR